MDDIKIDLLTEEEIFGNIAGVGILSCFKNGIHRNPSPTDLAVTTGLKSSRDNVYYWIKSSNGIIKPTVSTKDGPESSDQYQFRYAIRPVLRLPEDLFYKLCFNYESSTYNTKIKYGLYPQCVPNVNTSKILEEKFTTKQLNKIEQVYTFLNNIKSFYKDVEIYPTSYPVYEYEGKKYIRVMPDFYGGMAHLSDHKYYDNNMHVWIEVTQIKWLADEKTRSFISERCLLSGIIFHNKMYNGNYEETIMYKYLNKYMLPEIIQSITLKEKNIRKVINNRVIKDTLRKIGSRLDNEYIIKNIENKIYDGSISKDELESLEDALKELKTEIKIRRR